MEKLAIFLRGVNVNGISIKMEELRAVIEALGYKNVKTILASGNVIADAVEELSYEEHRSKIEEGLSSHFGYEAYVIMKTAKQIEGIIKEAACHEVPEGCHHYILLTKDNSIGQQLMELFHTCSKAENEQFLLGEQGIYWIVPKGSTLESAFGSQILSKKVWKSVLTSRTMNTIQKMVKYLS
jgi:uncharacterized protein (DUF1697 family)